MTYQELYQTGVNELDGLIAEARIDARYLLEAVCHTDRNTLLAHGDMEVTPEQVKEYMDKIAVRKTRVPLQHILGEQEFMGLTFTVNEHVLIPRQDTEVLVEEVMRYLHDGMQILDMCTGSGCILLSLLHYSNGCTGTGVDISEQALAVARKNADALGKDVTLLQSNLFEQVEGQYDIIVSNPPYIQTDVIKTLEPEVREHEPMIALDGYEDGLYFYRHIVEECKPYLWSNGMLFFEIGYDQGESVKLLMEEAGFVDVAIVKDFSGLDRVVLGTLIK